MSTPMISVTSGTTLDPMASGHGIYAIQFPHCVKVGRSGHLRGRIWTHRRDGGTSYVAYSVPAACELAEVEAEVLAAVRVSGAHAVQGHEWFCGRTFEQVAWTVERTLQRLLGSVELAASVSEGETVRVLVPYGLGTID